MDKIKEIEKAILWAEAGQSGLDAETLAIGGMTGEKIRHLMNNLGAISKNYFEIGVHRGSLFFSTLCGNKLESAVACDDFSQFNTDGAEDEFRKRIRGYAGNPSLAFINSDCFKMNTATWEHLVKSDGTPVERPDLYLYDGNHGPEETKRGITHFAPMMADVFILCVDDYNWADVQNGTRDGIEAAGLKVLADWHLGIGSESDGAGYWNGYGVFLCQK